MEQSVIATPIQTEQAHRGEEEDGGGEEMQQNRGMEKEIETEEIDKRMIQASATPKSHLHAKKRTENRQNMHKKLNVKSILDLSFKH